MAKWTELTRTLDRLPAGSGEFDSPRDRERMDAEKAKLFEERLSPGGLTERYLSLRDEEDAAEAAFKAVKLRRRAMEEVIIEVFEAQEMESMKLRDGRGVRTEPTPHASVQDPELARAWAKKQGLSGKLTLPWQTLNSHVKELMDAGKGAPDPNKTGIKVWLKMKIVPMGR